MPIRLSTTQKNFVPKLKEFMTIRDDNSNEISDTVRDIIAAIRKKGDKALCKYTSDFDNYKATTDTIKVSEHDKADALALCQPELMTSIKIAAKRIREYSEKQMPTDLDYTDDAGIRLGHRWNAIDAVGLYVPGGLASYPSSVLMNAVPAIVAGVKRLTMVVPAPDGKINPAVLGAAHILGIEEIYKVGGAQAIAALTYGTDTITPVDKIVGPGNAYVAEAKRQVFGKVGIDMIAGPSEVLVIADNQNDPAWIAADLLSQAEHDAMAQSILITDDETFSKAVEEQIHIQLKTLSRRDIASASWKKYGAIIHVENFNDACELANILAPEHLELAVENADELSKHILHAGAIFIGRYSPEALGDYIAGPSHVLPTSRTARFSSGLSVLDFMKRSSIISSSQEGIDSLCNYIEVLSITEGLEAHYHSANMRRKPS